MSDTRKSGLLLPVVITIAVLLGLYVGGYYSSVLPVEYQYESPFVLPDYRCPFESFLYSGGGRIVRWRNEFAVFFAPIHWIDRRIRPHAWETTNEDFDSLY